VEQQEEAKRLAVAVVVALRRPSGDRRPHEVRLHGPVDRAEFRATADSAGNVEDLRKNFSRTGASSRRMSR
jgi:hypothetical protein